MALVDLYLSVALLDYRGQLSSATDAPDYLATRRVLDLRWSAADAQHHRSTGGGHRARAQGCLCTQDRFISGRRRR